MRHYQRILSLQASRLLLSDRRYAQPDALAGRPSADGLAFDLLLNSKPLRWAADQVHFRSI
jgi:hypothetical protein